MDQGIAAVDAKVKSSGSMAVTMAIRKKTPRVGGKTAISAATAWLTRTFLFIRLLGDKAFYQEVSVTKAEDGFRVFNRHYFIPLDHKLQWEITEDGKVIGNGSSHLVTAPQSSELFAVVLPEMNPTKSYYINFKTLTLSANELLPEGYPIATDQILLQKGVKPEAAPVAYKVKVTHKGERIVLRDAGARWW